LSDGLDAAFALTRGGFALDVRIAAPLGAISAVFGPSGSGKSVTLAALAGLVRITRGSIRFRGRTLADAASSIHVAPHLRRVGLAFQEGRLFPHLDVRGNLAFAAERNGATAEIETMGARFEAAHLLDRRVRHLSGGERSRIGLVRALLGKPDLLLLDEPFAALDQRGRAALIAPLRQSVHGLTTLLVTHDIDEAAALAERLVVIENGRTIAEGPFAAIAANRAFQALLPPHDRGAALPRSALASTAPASGSAWVRADAVLLASREPQGLSARNIFRGHVVEIDAETPTSMMATLATPAGTVRARITAAAMEDLTLAPGSRCWAIIKAHQT
jgi:molybdate transport system ATP-binding protein